MKLNFILSSRFLGRILCLGALSVALMGGTTAQAEVTDKQFEDMMQKYLGTPAGKESLGKAVEGYFMEKQQQAAKDRQRQEQDQLESQFKNPVKIDLGSSPVKGPAGAKITIVEFSDFECPFCKRGRDIMQQVMKMYPNDVKVVFKHLPLDFHAKAEPASRAAIAAGNQGKFWEMYNALFDNQTKIGDEFYLEQAKILGLNIDKFKADMAAEATKKQIEDDKAIAKANQIQGTPAFFVNGVAVRGAYPPDHFKTIIDRLLKGEEKKAA
jgi:protein-disulfide isomerase